MFLELDITVRSSSLVLIEGKPRDKSPRLSSDSYERYIASTAPLT